MSKPVGRRSFLKAAGGVVLAGAHGAAGPEVNVAFCGGGQMARVNLAACARVAGFRVVHVGDERSSRALLDDPLVDAVCLSLSESGYASMTVEACRAGKDGYVETPARMRLEDGAAIARAARQYGRVVQTGAVARSGALFQTVRAIVKSGELGEIAYCGIRGSAALLDLVHFAFDEPAPVSVTAQAGPATSLATFRYPGFVIGCEEWARGPYAAGGIAIHGSRATLRVEREGCRIFRGDASQAILVEAGRGDADARELHWRDWLESIRARRQPSAGIGKRVRVAAAGLLADLSLRQNRTVAWDDLAGGPEV